MHFNYLKKFTVFFNKIYCNALQVNVETGIYQFFFHCFAVHFNSLNFIYQLMHFYIQ